MALGVFEPMLMATAEGKAPNIATVRVERVEELAVAAAGFEADASLSYAKIAQNPTIYTGQKAAFEGRVYNVAVEGGQSVLQVLARECPDGTRCPLWITYPASAEFTVTIASSSRLSRKAEVMERILRHCTFR